jgi:probable HAF family extracellular repeat protein
VGAGWVMTPVAQSGAPAEANNWGKPPWVAINDVGQIVGTRGTGRSVVHAFVWQKGKLTDLGSFRGFSSLGLAINDRGQVAGFGTVQIKPNGDRVDHAFLWQNGRMRDFGTCGTKPEEQLNYPPRADCGNAINNLGQVLVNGAVWVAGP